MAVVLAAVVFVIARHSGWLAPAAAVVVALEWWMLVRLKLSAKQRQELAVSQFPVVVLGVSMAAVIALESRLAGQAVTAGVYAALRWWWADGVRRGRTKESPGHLQLWRSLAVQAVLFEAVFLAAAILKPSSWQILVMVWIGVYG